jgi:hypothetical protein
MHSFRLATVKTTMLIYVHSFRQVDQDPELESLSDWVRTIRSLVQGRIHKLKIFVNSRPKSVFKDQEAVKCLSSLHDKYVIVPAEKASNNIVFVCKSYYFDCLLKELGINSNTSSNTSFVEQVDDPAMYLSLHGVLWSLGIQYKWVNPQTLYQRECLKRS